MGSPAVASAMQAANLVPRRGFGRIALLLPVLLGPGSIGGCTRGVDSMRIAHEAASKPEEVADGVGQLLSAAGGTPGRSAVARYAREHPRVCYVDRSKLLVQLDLATAELRFESFAPIAVPGDDPGATLFPGVPAAGLHTYTTVELDPAPGPSSVVHAYADGDDIVFVVEEEEKTALHGIRAVREDETLVRWDLVTISRERLGQLRQGAGEAPGTGGG